jgi:hypothetical protein
MKPATTSPATNIPPLRERSSGHLQRMAGQDRRNAVDGWRTPGASVSHARTRPVTEPRRAVGFSPKRSGCRRAESGLMPMAGAGRAAAPTAPRCAKPRARIALPYLTLWAHWQDHMPGLCGASLASCASSAIARVEVRARSSGIWPAAAGRGRIECGHLNWPQLGRVSSRILGSGIWPTFRDGNYCRVKQRVPAFRAAQHLARTALGTPASDAVSGQPRPGQAIRCGGGPEGGLLCGTATGGHALD